MKNKGQTIVEFTILLFVAGLCLINFLNLCTNIAKKSSVVSKVISAEACGEGEIGMYLVANTIANRVRLTNKTPYEVVTEPKQYQGLINPHRDELYEQCGEFSDELVKQLLDLPDMTKGALYFKRPEEERKAWHKTLTVIYKNHEFYKD